MHKELKLIDQEENDMVSISFTICAVVCSAPLPMLVSFASGFRFHRSTPRLKRPAISIQPTLRPSFRAQPRNILPLPHSCARQTARDQRDFLNHPTHPAFVLTGTWHPGVRRAGFYRGLGVPRVRSEFPPALGSSSRCRLSSRAPPCGVVVGCPAHASGKGRSRPAHP